MKLEEFAERCQVHISTLLGYAKEGLLPQFPTWNPEHEFSERDVDLVRFIRLARQRHTPLKRLQLFCRGFFTSQELQIEVKFRISSLQHEIEQLQSKRASLQEHLDRLERGETSDGGQLADLLDLLSID